MPNEKTNIPKHVAVIPDGNRRWARNRGLKPWIGHQKGIRFEKVLEMALDLGITYFTFWGGSLDNLTKRPKLEVSFLYKLYAEQFERISKDERIHKNQVRIIALGRWKEILPQKTQTAIHKAMAKTKNYKKHVLTFLLAYNGTDEMADCIQKIAAKSGKKPTKITNKLIKENLWTKDLPPVDLVIRTGCQDDPHNSTGFMMWDTAYSQFHFTKTLFPDFGTQEFEEIIKDYSKKERRHGT